MTAAAARPTPETAGQLYHRIQSQGRPTLWPVCAAGLPGCTGEATVVSPDHRGGVAEHCRPCDRVMSTTGFAWPEP